MTLVELSPVRTRAEMTALTYFFAPRATFTSHTNTYTGILRISCPNGHTANATHEVKPDGTVNPSLVCPWNDPSIKNPCDWHVFGKLLNWTHGHRLSRAVQK